MTETMASLLEFPESLCPKLLFTSHFKNDMGRDVPHGFLEPFGIQFIFGDRGIFVS